MLWAALSVRVPREVIMSAAITAPRERLPARGNWVQVHGADSPAIAISAWQCGPVCVITALEDAEYPDGDGHGPQWHVSISRRGQRPSADDVTRALRAFGLVGAEEDNHHPGNARHFWLPVDPAHRVDCECKATEVTVVEPDGYTWTNPHDAAECRGCEFQRGSGKPCPIHSASRVTP
jgi:hypothetical protein